MVKITDGREVFEVTKGAFETIFKDKGWQIVNENIIEPVVEQKVLTEDEKFEMEVVEKPIASWSKEELKRFANLKGISLEGVHSTNEVREIIKNYIG